MTIRRSTLTDLPEIRQLFHDTITTVNRKDYTDQQVEMWASSAENERKWQKKFKSEYFIVAEHHEAEQEIITEENTEQEKMLVGFSSLDEQGFIDYIFVHKDHQRKGIASAMLAEMEKLGMMFGMKTLISEVSITARPFFSARGFVSAKKNKRRIKGVEFTNFLMKKVL